MFAVMKRWGAFAGYGVMETKETIDMIFKSYQEVKRMLRDDKRGKEEVNKELA